MLDQDFGSFVKLLSHGKLRLTNFLFGNLKLVCVNGVETFWKQFSIWLQQLAHVFPLVFVPLTGTNLGLPTWVCHFKFGVLITRHRWVISLLISCHSRVIIWGLNRHRRVSGVITLYRLVVSGVVIKCRWVIS